MEDKVWWICKECFGEFEGERAAGKNVCIECTRKSLSDSSRCPPSQSKQTKCDKQTS